MSFNLSLAYPQGGTLRKRIAFTLIELLVVVAIIALLIAILLPSLGAARRIARTATCLANTRSMGMALQLYVQDWTRVFPYSTNPVQSWTQLLMNGGKSSASGYTKSGGYGGVDKMRVCPEAPVPAASAAGNTSLASFGTAQLQWTNSPETGIGVSASYGFNGWLYDYVGGSPSDVVVLKGMADQRGSVNSYSDTFYRVPLSRNDSLAPVMADADWRQIFAKSGDTPPTNLINTGLTNVDDHPLGRACLDRHKRAVNVSFLDGHGETVKLPQLWGLYWSKNWISPTLPIIH